VASVFGGVSAEETNVDYKRIDKVIIRRQWYDKRINEKLGFEDIGNEYEVWNRSGGKIDGFENRGNGLYRKKSINIGGFNVIPES
jgi:hypothetical protein